MSGFEGERKIIEDTDFFFYRFIKGAWRLLANTALFAVDGVIKGDGSGGFSAATSDDFPVECLEETLTITGDFAVGDLIVKVPAKTNVILYRTVENNAAGWANAGFFGTDAQEEYAQRFKAPFNFTVKSFGIYMEKDGTPADNVTCKLFDDDSEPDTLLETSADVVAGGTIDASTVNKFSFGFNTPLTGGEYYWFVMDRSGANNGTNFYNIRKPDGSSLSNASTLWPDSEVKISSDPLASWGSAVASPLWFEIKGDIAASYQKWHGSRSNILVEPIGVVVEKNGSVATVVTSGLAEGLSGLTEGGFLEYSGFRVGLCLSSSTAHIFTRKPFILTGLSVQGTNGTIFFPLGFIPLTVVCSDTLDVTTVPGEGKLTWTTNATLALTNEYKSI